MESFDPLTLLTLKYRGRSVAVLREKCLRHESLLAVARRTFPSLQYVSAGDFVLMAPIPGYPEPEPVELLPDIWTTVCHVVHAVTIALESEMPSVSGETTACGSPVASATRLPVAAAVTTPSSSSSSSSRPAPPAPPQPRMETLFSRLWSGQSEPAPPVQPQKTPQPALRRQSVIVSFPAFSLAPLARFNVSELGLLRKKVSRVYDFLDPQYGYSASNSTLTFQSLPLNTELTFSDYGIVDGDTIQLDQEIRIGKPVIYLYPTSSLADVTVELALTSSWRFSAVHPPPKTTIPPGEPHKAQSLTWSVTAEPNGTLVDKTSGMEVSYLYWEGTTHTNSQLMTPSASRATTPVANTETFDPVRPIVDPTDSVLLPISKVPTYLDAALKALTLHTEARTSFITYWLPDLLKHEYVALRFIAQDAYEQAASLRIAPAPDVVTRVFMLFRGVAAGDLGLWEAAGTGADEPTFWADIVGVDAARAADSSLFRVLEWGGMEVQ